MLIVNFIFLLLAMWFLAKHRNDISRHGIVFNYLISWTNKAEEIKGTYLFSKQLTDKETNKFATH